MYAVTEVQHVIAVPTCSTDTLLVSLLGGAIAMAHESYSNLKLL